MFEGTDWSPLVTAISNVNWTAVIAAMITGTAAACGPMLLWYKQSVKEQKSVRAALMAEVSGLVELLQYRDFLPSIREVEVQLKIEAIRLGIFEAPPSRSLVIPVAADYNKVFQGNIGKLGYLSKGEASQIVRFYQYAEAFKIDVSETGGLGRGTTRHEDFKKVGDLLQKLLELGNALTRTEKSQGWCWRRKPKL
ncbi:hypothetical protein WKQ99_27050 [Pseudomonas atacamensis]|uniref:hypothetical protein n=1 Tax=Pseudomonas atacamensis TaxID=2565368 RepID=UPI0030CC8EC5